ncbi:hypothetical protein L1987_75398 [Smallanthus sonchifolius]|uniref:Uncharacterized protein n=1 Tax=Smallanthus sonchifolius TaxID=185202 RepID=A0ACB9A6D7_9ASTR|nr:hypothetical protein L1987_75398 [Smallanthus sonchifolius]
MMRSAPSSLIEHYRHRYGPTRIFRGPQESELPRFRNDGSGLFIDVEKPGLDGIISKVCPLMIQFDLERLKIYVVDHSSDPRVLVK